MPPKMVRGEPNLAWGSGISATRLTSRLRILGTVKFASVGKRLYLVAPLSPRT